MIKNIFFIIFIFLFSFLTSCNSLNSDNIEKYLKEGKNEKIKNFKINQLETIKINNMSLINYCIKNQNTELAIYLIENNFSITNKTYSNIINYSKKESLKTYFSNLSTQHTEMLIKEIIYSNDINTFNFYLSNYYKKHSKINNENIIFYLIKSKKDKLAYHFIKENTLFNFNTLDLYNNSIFHWLIHNQNYELLENLFKMEKTSTFFKNHNDIQLMVEQLILQNKWEYAKKIISFSTSYSNLNREKKFFRTLMNYYRVNKEKAQLPQTYLKNSYEKSEYEITNNSNFINYKNFVYFDNMTIKDEKILINRKITEFLINNNPLLLNIKNNELNIFKQNLKKCTPTDEFYNLLLRYSLVSKKVEFATEILKYNFDPSDYGCHEKDSIGILNVPILISIKNNYNTISKQIIDKTNNLNVHSALYIGNFTNKGFENILTLAIKQDNKEIIKYILNKGFNPNIPNLKNYPLIIAIQNNNIAITKILLNYNIDVNIKYHNYEGFKTISPLHLAVIQQNIEILSLLLEKGVSPNSIAIQNDHTEITAIDLARKTKAFKVLKILNNNL